jgi:hypothetical protein
MSSLTGTVADATGHAIEGLAVDLLTDSGERVTALTDAAGAYRAEIVDGVTYRLAVPVAVRLNGAAYAYPAGTVFALTAYAIPGPVQMVEDVAGGLVTMAERAGQALGSLALVAALGARIDALEARVAALEQSVAVGGMAAGAALRDAAGEVT